MTELNIICRVEALYPFKSNDPSSLCFNQYDQINVLSKLPSGWWDGLCNGTRGWFPSNYVKVVEEAEEESIRTKRNHEYRLSFALSQDTWKTEEKSADEEEDTLLNGIMNEYDEWPEEEDIPWAGHTPEYTPPETEEEASVSWAQVAVPVTATIQQLSGAAKTGQSYLYYTYGAEIVNAVRTMLVASSTLDKESGHIKMNSGLRAHHRAMITSMSKLVLTAQTCYTLDNTTMADDTVSKILSESQELQLMVRHFLGACQELGIPMYATDPQWLETTPSESSPRQRSRRDSLQANLLSHLDKIGKSIQECAEIMTKSVSAHLTLMIEGTVPERTSLATLLFSHFRLLSSQTSTFLSYLEDADFAAVEKEAEMVQLRVAKQQVCTALGTIFYRLQTLTDEQVDLETTLMETEVAAARLYEPIDVIALSVEILVSTMKERAPLESSVPDDFVVKPSQKLAKFFGDDVPLSTAPTASEKPHFLEHDYKPEDIVFTMDNYVKGATLPALVERLTLHDELDMNFINTFLLTYRSFCTSSELLDLLEARYTLQCPDGLTAEEAVVWEEKKLKLIRLRVFNVLKNWLESYYSEDDNEILERILQFTQTHINVTLKFSNGQLESLIQRRKESGCGGVMKRMIPTLVDPPEPILPRSRKNFKLLDIDALEMARQLTIMDFKLYSAIRPIECLDKDISSPGDQTNIRASIAYCNQVTAWVSDVILSQHDIKKRSMLIKYWVQVAEKCKLLNNFNTCMAILSAFDNSSVGRLKRTWEVVGKGTTQTLQQIRKMMGANRNFTEYRAIIHSINPPCVPFLGIYLQDLTFIEDGNPNVLRKYKELINFAKRAKKAEVIREIQQYQSSSYQLKAVPDIQEFIKSNLKSTRDEDQLYKESLKLEPREREDEKITRLLQESGFL